jgi:superfamily II DNA or RNA helicase
MPLYKYQQEGSDKIQVLLDENKSVIYQLPTGGGKSYVIQDIVEKNKHKKIMLLVHKREIIFQLYDNLKSSGFDVGIMVGDIEKNTNANVLVGSILTVSRDKRIQGVMDRKDDILIIDEAHHACSSSYQKIIDLSIKNNPNFNIFGVTATPYRKDKKKLSLIFDKLVVGPTINELQEQGYLCNAKTYIMNLEDVEHIQKSGGDYNISKLSKFMRNDSLINSAIQEYEDKGMGKQMLVFCVDQKHGLKVQNAYIEKGYSDTSYIDSNTPNDVRDNIIKEFRGGNIKILVSIQTLTEGTDIPNASVCQLLRPTLSLVLYLQILGRVLRVKDDKSEAIILDISNCSKEHGLVNSPKNWNLDNIDPNLEKGDRKLIAYNAKDEMVDDLEEITEEGLEVTEVSYDDFLKHSKMGVEEAQSINSDIVDQKYNKLCEIRDIISQKLPQYNFEIPKKEDIYNFKEIKVKEGGENLVNITYLYDENDIFLNKVWTQKENLRYYNKLGIISNTLSIKKTLAKILVLFIGIKTLESKKIDINKLRSETRLIKLEKIENNINSQIKRGEYEFKFWETFSMSRLNTSRYKQIDTVIINQKHRKLGIRNTVILKNGSDLIGEFNIEKECLLDVVLDLGLRE